MHESPLYIPSPDDLPVLVDDCSGSCVLYSPRRGQRSRLIASRVNGLALDVERAEAVRAVKTLQRSYAQYVQFGLWNEMASLFSESVRFINDTENISGRAAILDYLYAKLGDSQQGLATGEFRTQLVLRLLINLSPDGQSAKGRWWEFSMLGRTGISAEWAAGIYENEYKKEQGFWKISRMHYCPMFAGPYDTGWFNVDEDQKVIPYHFTAVTCCRRIRPRSNAHSQK